MTQGIATARDKNTKDSLRNAPWDRPSATRFSILISRKEAREPGKKKGNRGWNPRRRRVASLRGTAREGRVRSLSCNSCRSMACPCEFPNSKNYYYLPINILSSLIERAYRIINLNFDAITDIKKWQIKTLNKRWTRMFYDWNWKFSDHARQNE